nr:tetratricopeptide repeat protein [Chthoniobacterales bacterium]
FLQACLDAGTATLLYKISRRVFAAVREGKSGADPTWTPGRAGEIIGVAAAAGWATFVPAQAYSVILMPTAWLVFVFWFLVWQCLNAPAPLHLGRCLLWGLLIGVTATGVATIFFIIPLVVTAIVKRTRRLSALAGVAMLLVGIFAGTAPCWMHNYFIAREPVFLSAHSGINFWIGNNPVANGYPRIPPGLRAGQSAMLQDSIDVAEAAAGHPLKRADVSDYWSEKARNYIRSHFGEWLQLTTTKFRNFWNAFQYDDLSIITSLREEGVILPGPRLGLIAALALPGMFFAAVRFPRSRWIAVAVLLHMMSLLGVFVTERYRLAAVPGLLLFAGFTLWKLSEFASKGRVANAFGMGAAIALSTLFVSLPQRDPALWALDAYNSGWQALESGNLPLAQRKLELARAYVPDNAEINLALGNLALAQSDSVQAKQFYASALQIDPDHKSALSNLGVLMLEERAPQVAASLFRRALKSTPADAKTHFLLARAEFESGNLRPALEEVEMAVRISPAQPEFQALYNEIVKASGSTMP